jgi:hypothetical protein
VLRFNADGPEGLIDGKAWGQPPKLNCDQRQALARLVEDGPIPRCGLSRSSRPSSNRFAVCW